MALPGTGIVNQGLQRIGINASVVGGGAGVGSSQTVTRYIMTLSVDDATGNFEAAHTAINGTGGTARTITNEFDQLLDALATRSGQVVSHVCTIATGNGNFTHKGIALHDDTATNVTSSSTTLVGGIAGQSITKTSAFALAYTVNITYTDNS